MMLLEATPVSHNLTNGIGRECADEPTVKMETVSSSETLTCTRTFEVGPILVPVDLANKQQLLGCVTAGWLCGVGRLFSCQPGSGN